jgi:hypothetical protein
MTTSVVAYCSAALLSSVRAATLQARCIQRQLEPKHSNAGSLGQAMSWPCCCCARGLLFGLLRLLLLLPHVHVCISNARWTLSTCETRTVHLVVALHYDLLVHLIALAAQLHCACL